MTAATDRLDRVTWLGWDGVTDLLGRGSATLLLLDAQGVDDDPLADALQRIDAAAIDGGMRIVVALNEGQIDLVSSILGGCEVTLLCAPGAAEWIAAVTLALVSIDATLPSSLREGDAERLALLQAELARIVEVLARLSHGEQDATPAAPGTVADVRPGFTAQADVASVTADDVRRLIRARRLRDRFFGDGIFEDPAWDMILDLFAAHLDGARVSVSSLCIAAAVAPTTALRWIAKLTQAGWFDRLPDPDDRRRSFITLSPRALDAMHRYVRAARDAGLAFT